MHVLDAAQVARRMSAKGIESLSALADLLGLHRNTLHYYLGGRPVFSAALDRIFTALDLDPAVAVVKKVSSLAVGDNGAIAPLVDQLHDAFPEAAYILFGSRAKGSARRYSDWDVGVFHRDGLGRDTFRKLVRIKSDWEENSPFFTDLVNLNGVDRKFLEKIIGTAHFLAGRQQDWLALIKQARA